MRKDYRILIASDVSWKTIGNCLKRNHTSFAKGYNDFYCCLRGTPLTFSLLAPLAVPFRANNDGAGGESQIVNVNNQSRPGKGTKARPSEYSVIKPF